MNKRFFIEGEIFKLQGVIENEEEVIEKLRFISKVLRAKPSKPRQEFNIGSKSTFEEIIETYNSVLEEEGLKLVAIDDFDKIVVKL